MGGLPGGGAEFGEGFGVTITNVLHRVDSREVRVKGETIVRGGGRGGGSLCGLWGGGSRGQGCLDTLGGGCADPM